MLKELEPVCIGVYLRDYDVLPGRDRFLENVIKAAPTVAGEQDCYGTQTLTDLAEIVSLCETPACISEIFGLNRLFGFPVIDEDSSIKNIRKIATPTPMSSRDIKAMELVSRRSAGALTKYYCLSYIRRYGRWPVVATPGENEVLKRWIETNTTNLNLIQDRGPSLDDWCEIKLGKQVDFDYFDDSSLLLSDTALSPGRSEFDSVYPAEFLGYSPPESTTSRRTMVEYLSRVKLDTREILAMISEERVPKEHFVVGLRTKERELAISPRCYGMLTLEMRTYFVLTEKNIANQLFPFFEFQTMTSSEARVSRRLMSLESAEQTSGTASGATFYDVVFNLDFSKWNLRFNSSNADEVMMWLDDYFGLEGVYKFTHTFFESSLFYLSSRYHPDPRLTPSTRVNHESMETVYESHFGGVEGLRQKGWTTATFAIILSVCDRLRWRASLTGQGDNQAVKLSIRLPDGVDPSSALHTHPLYIQSSLETFFTQLTKEFETIGLPLKSSETWWSKDTWIYSKDWVVSSAVMPISLKRATRIQSDTNDVLPDLGACLSTSWTSGLAAAAKGLSPFGSYVVSSGVAWSEICSHARRSPVSGLESQEMVGILRKKKTAAAARLYLLTPTALGGMVSIPFLHMLYRGHPDDLTEALSTLRLSDLKEAKALLNLIEKKVYWPVKARSIEPLVMDPQGVLFGNSASSLAPLKDGILDELRTPGRVANEDLVRMIECSTDEERDKVLSYLERVRPRNPRLLSEIFLRTVPGQMDRFIARFANTRSLTKLITTGPKVVARVGKLGSSHLASFSRLFTLVQATQRSPGNMCTTLLAQEMRDSCWGSARIGVEFDESGTPDDEKQLSIVGVTVPHPSEQCGARTVKQAGEIDPRSGKAYLIETDRDYKQASHPGYVCLGRGPYPPYTGSETKEKIVSKLFNIPVSDGALFDASRLTLIAGWVTTPGSELFDLLCTFARSRCMFPPDIISKGLEDSLVCAICGFPEPGLLRDLELISLAPAVSKMTCKALHAMLQDSLWLREVTAAWNRLCAGQRQLSCHELLAALQSEHRSSVAILRATRRRIRLQLRDKQEEAQTQAKARHAACFTGWIFIPLESRPTTFTHQCNICGHHCATASGLAVHKLHRHGRAADAGITGSATLCPTCGIEFWEPYRLRDHLRKHSNCLLPFVESDVDFEGHSRTSHQQLAWRPAVKVPFVQPWWATLNPERTEAFSTASNEHSASIAKALNALDLALKKQHSPKSALEALFERVREAKSCTECALSEFVSIDHPLFSFAELAAWLARCPGGPCRFDGIGFRAAVDSGNVMIRLAGASGVDSTDPVQHALMRSLL